MNKPIRVAMLVHNDVKRDARVRKEARSLVEAGYDVDVYGISNDLGRIGTSQIEGATLRLLRSNKRALLRSWLEKGVIAAAALIFVALAIAAFTLGDTHWQLRWLIFIAVPAMLIAANSVRPQLSPGNLRLRLVELGLGFCASALSIYLLDKGLISLPEIIAQFALLWFISGSGLNVFHFLKQAGKLKKAYSRSGHNIQSRHRALATLLFNGVRKRKYDIVHSHDLIGLLAGKMIKEKNPDTVLIWDAHEIYEGVPDIADEYFKLCREIILNSETYIDRFITINKSIAQFYAANYNLPPASIVMNATRAVPSVQYDGRLHNAAGLPQTQKILLFQGGFAEYRGLDALMRAVPSIPRDWSVVAMGWGKLKSELDRVAKEAEAADRPPALVVIPPAAHDELVEWTAGATLGIIPYENVCLNHLYCTPNKLWEYPNAGVPILATDVVEMAEMINQWGTGFLLPRDLHERDIVRFLEKTPDSEISRAKKNCERFSEEMGWHRFESVLLDLYGSLHEQPQAKQHRRKVAV
ncbi:MAG: glycosyltransferase family 4 protein [Rhizobiaceae bacterium]|nr:glycosyltransferase family 4 protein [Rhizobiaceae bacterium]